MSDLKLYGVSLQIESAAGYQTFGVMASSEEDAMERFKRGESTDDILYSEVEVLGLEKNFGIDDVECYEGIVNYACGNNGWISVDERLPEDDGSVFVWPYPDETCFTGYHDGQWKDDIIGELIEVTHWHPILEGPTK